MNTLSRPTSLELALAALLAILVFGAPQAALAQQVVYGATYHVKNAFDAGTYLDTCGYAQCASETLYSVSTSSNPNRDSGSGSWTILSASGKSPGQPVLVGDIVHLQNRYGNGSYLDTCSYAQCAVSTTYAVRTATSSDRDSGSGSWAIVSKDKPNGQPISTKEEIMLRNQYVESTYLDTCRYSQCASSTIYGVSTSTEANRDSGSGIWSFVPVGTSLDGSYALDGSNGQIQLGLAAGPGDDQLRATLSGFVIDANSGMRIQSMTLEGTYSLEERASEDFFLFVLSGSGTVVDGNGNTFPATFSLSGFRSATGANASLTTQWASSFEHAGFAEGVAGAQAVWTPIP